MAGEKTKMLTLPQEIVEVRYIKKQTGIITNEKHVLFGGLAPGAKITFRPKKLRNGGFNNVLTKEEIEGLESIFEIPGYLSIYKKENNYWDNLKIDIGADGLRLDLSKPDEYIVYRVLQTIDDQIAPSLEAVEKGYKRTYRFVLVRQNEEAKSKLKKLDLNKEAYKLLDKIEYDRDALKDYLMLNGIHVAEDTTIEWMAAEAGKHVVDNPVKFVQTLKDPSYSTRVLLFKAIDRKEIFRKNNHYYSKDGEPIAEPNQPPTLENAIRYLESGINQEYRLVLMNKTK